MARRGRPSTRFSQPRRKLVWADTLVAQAAITAPQQTDLLAGLRAVAGAGTLGVTVVRCHISQNAVVAAGTGDNATNVRVGLIVVPVTVEAVDIAPVTEPELDWMWNVRYHVGNTAITIPHDNSTQVDIRSKRKVDEIGQTLMHVVEPELGSATSLTYRAHVRVLLMLP